MTKWIRRITMSLRKSQNVQKTTTVNFILFLTGLL